MFPYCEAYSPECVEDEFHEVHSSNLPHPGWALGHRGGSIQGFQLPGRGILRTSPFPHSANFTLTEFQNSVNAALCGLTFRLRFPMQLNEVGSPTSECLKELLVEWQIIHILLYILPLPPFVESAFLTPCNHHLLDVKGTTCFRDEVIADSLSISS